MPPSSSRKSKASKRRGLPLQDLRMNPFTSPEQQRINYPGLDAAFQFDSSLSSANLSICSPDRSSIAAPPSDLNMSIGARAAIYEHTRYISKFGLEGEFSKPSTPSHSTTYGLDEWDRIMDDVPCNTSLVADSHASTSFSNHYYLNGNKSLMDSSMNRGLADTTFYEDHQSDFFNTSRVMQYLATPEKNKQKVDEASRLARLGVGVMTRNSNDSICHSHCGSASGTDLERSGMIGLFHAALKFEKECYSANGHCDGDDENENHADGDLDEDTGGESFVSYHEPNMSVIELHQQSLLEEDVDHPLIQIYDGDQNNNIRDNGSAVEMEGPDVHCSFVSYHEPDLTVLSAKCEEEIPGALRPPSEFEQSEFQVDVSEIMAPSEFENKFAMASYAARLGTLSENKQPMGYYLSNVADQERLRYSCTSPILQELHDKYHVHDDEVSWPSDSPASRPSNRTMNAQTFLRGRHEDNVQDDSPQINRSLIRYFESTTGNSNGNTNVSFENGKTHQELDRRIEMESEAYNTSAKSPTKTKYANQNATSSKIKSVKSISTREKERAVHQDIIPRQIGLMTHGTDIKVHDIHPFDNLSPLSPPRSRTAGGRGGSLIASSTFKSRKPAPLRMSLRERYTHRDRFEDSFTVPSYASTLSSTPRAFSDDEFGSMNKSPLGPFACDIAFDSPDQASLDHRRFAA